MTGRAARGPAPGRGRAARPQGRRGPRPGPRHGGHPRRLCDTRSQPAERPAVMLLSRSVAGSAAAAADPRQRVRGRGRGGRRGRHASSRSATGLRRQGFRFGAYAEFICMRRAARIAHMPAGMSFAEAAAVCDGGLNALWCLRRRPAEGAAGPRLRRIGRHRHGGRAARQVLRRRRHRGMRHARTSSWCSSLGADR